MPILRFQAILEHTNGLPRDAVVNTFHVSAPSAGDWEDLVNNFTDFYGLDITGSRSVGDWLSPSHPNVYVKAYEVNDTIVDDRVMSGSGAPLGVSLTQDVSSNAMSGVPLPAEVACCLSMRSNTVPSIPRARRTGRIYIGPLNDGALAPPTGDGIARPAQGLLTDLRAAAARLKAGIIADGGTWVVYSRPFPGRDAVVRPGRTTLPALAARPNMTTHVIDQVWTDDAFDTQRRRGEKATAKTVLAV